MDIVKNSGNTPAQRLPVIPITKTSDLLKCKPVMIMIKEHGEEPVTNYVMKAVTKAANQLEINYQADFIQTLTEDILDVFKYESIEDIAECLKRGRQGRYGLNYGKFNMIIIREWMSKHLEDKAKAREDAINNAKLEEKELDVHGAYVDLMEDGIDSSEKLSDLELIRKADLAIGDFVRRVKKK